ncbi:MAG: YihA family ribosome biogenesis GTP-binding protein, partial [Pseudomonadota bacterium]|nr:YihA family ribosome biogenesis GTP-binding protein [Pseudomonadota bacterium]
YGFAKAPKAEVAAWTRLIRDYLRGRVGLRRLCLLIDARHGLKPVDREIMDLMEESAVVFQIVLTKCDKAKKLPQLIAATEKTVGEYRAGAPQVIATSSRQNLGIADLRAELAKLALDEALG